MDGRPPGNPGASQEVMAKYQTRIKMRGKAAIIPSLLQSWQMGTDRRLSHVTQSSKTALPRKSRSKPGLYSGRFKMPFKMWT